MEGVRSTAGYRFCKLNNDGRTVCEEDEAIKSSPADTRKFLEQFEDENRVTAALGVAGAAAKAIQEVLAGESETADWMTHPEIAECLAGTDEGMRWLVGVAETAGNLQAIAREVEQ